MNLTFDAFYYNALALLKYADYHFEQIEEDPLGGHSGLRVAYIQKA